MQILKLQMNNFRSFKEKIIEFSPKTTIIVGPNTSGKTNIIEAIYLLSCGKSFRVRIEEEMVSYDEEIARVKGAIIEDVVDLESGLSEIKKQGTNLEVVLTRGEVTIGENPEKIEKVVRKKLLINGVGKRLVDFSGIYKIVLFGPWDMDLVTDSPSIRRRFLDSVLSQVDREYRRASLSYEKGLRQRNKLLWQIREYSIAHPVHSGRARLLFWDKLLIKNGDYISRKREEFIEFVNNSQLSIFNISPSLMSQAKSRESQFSLEYDKSAISESRLEQYANEEIAAATTLVGPHRDDFIFKIRNTKREIRNEHELARYGSRGEQRMGVLWLKMAELAFIKEKTGENPTLLLDDIFSELDHEHREIVMDLVKGQQTIITTADPHFIEGFKKVEKIQLKA
ncbi:hypothetical protein A2159_02705 [Candidatus Woesebacteria bacterium RBG_13_34_9]|uniref:DNA replication and repair protein RecF n=1 Tax=Candidatus Woesebacteria bacterium RBG_13_34_9 TaxID=1802477 RepID=A0A1F7X090_9BACT|nr:MAG: hypothetical protein A2159_02705 [Candidatus Woesebacteria bacterium RBG_13_34_9]